MSDNDDIKTDEVRELPRKEVWPAGRDNTANILDENRDLSEPLSDAEAKRAMFRRSRRGFIVGSAAALIGIFGWRWMSDETKYKLLRGSLEFDEWVSESLYSPKRLAPEFSPERISPERVNGMEGLSEGFDPSAWKLTVAGIGANEITLTLDDIKKLPRAEMITEFKCIEGWSIIQQWAGVRFSDLVIACFDSLETGRPYELPKRVSKYVSIATPDAGYFVGWDIDSIMHPQTLLAYEINGKPLSNEHGAPLRLASPLKYGIKQIKRIGRIEFTNERPKDYWAQEGYDWYSGH